MLLFLVSGELGPLELSLQSCSDRDVDTGTLQMFTQEFWTLRWVLRISHVLYDIAGKCVHVRHELQCCLFQTLTQSYPAVCFRLLSWSSREACDLQNQG